MDKNKVLYLNSAFTKELPKASDTIDSIFIEGYASTIDIDRSGDVVPASVWEAGIKNYLKNPIILAQHDHDDPIGRMVEHKLDAKGLWIKARISAAAEVFSLIKDEVLTAFSIGFRVLDAEYNSAAEVFVIKELELVEISVVSVPCNQNTIFSLSKAFDSAEDFKNFKAQFIPKAESAKGLESLEDKKSTNQKEWKMDPKELQTMLDNAAKSAAEQATKALLEAQLKEKAEAEAKAAADAAFEAKVKEAVTATIKVGESGAEKLLKDIEARFNDESAKSSKMLEDLQGALKEKAAEIAALQTNKMKFTEDKSTVEYAEREKAVLLSKIMGKSIESTKFGTDLITKMGGHVATGAVSTPQSIWETEVSTNMEAEIRRKLVVAPLLRNINMQTNVMRIPVNPEAGYATWMANTAFGTTSSTGAAQTHQLKEITLAAYKVATLEYLPYEESEDSILVLLPIIRDGMVRRVARAVDKAYLMGTATTNDPVGGLASYDTTSVVTASTAGAATMANMRNLRKDLGAWGLDPAEVTYIVSTEVYYDLLDDTSFQTMNQVGVQATLLTGQVGSIGNSPVLVSAEFPTKAAGTAYGTTNYGAIAVASGNFIAGNQRGLRFDTQDMAETQRKVLVASLRTGLTQVTTNLGQGVSVFRWV